MKRFFTLLAFLLPFLSLMAQSQTTEEAKRVILGERRDDRNTNTNNGNPKDVVLGRDGRPIYDERSNYPGGNRQGRINEINREYDAKIRSIRNNRTLSRAEQDRIIRDLEQQRNRRIREINGRDDNRRYDNRRNERGRDDRDWDDDRDRNKNKNKYKGNKGNNGKRLGWEKGKGNPHRNRQ